MGAICILDIRRDEMIYSCYGCNDRTPYCHVSCEKYNDEKKRYIELRKANADPCRVYVTESIVSKRDRSAKLRQRHKLKAGCIR